MKTVPLFLFLEDIAYRMKQIDVDELDADYEQHLQRERDKPPDSKLVENDHLCESVGDGKDA